MTKPMQARDDLLVQPSWLEQHLDDPAVRILDCTTYMIPQPVGPSKIVSGKPDYLQGHIPGAQHVDMVTDLSDPAGRYPYTLPPPQQIERLLSRLGISNEQRIIIYGRSSVMTLTRTWYVLHTMGHQNIALLDGSFARWQAEGRPVTSDLLSFEASSYRATPDLRHLADLAEVRAAINDAETILVNALSPEQFTGSGGAHYGRPGRIPGSVSIPARNLADPETMLFESPERLRQYFEQAGVFAKQRVIHYCGGGIAATTTAFALEMLGSRDWAVYDNSLLEWADRSDTPMQTGA